MRSRSIMNEVANCQGLLKLIWETFPIPFTTRYLSLSLVIIKWIKVRFNWKGLKVGHSFFHVLKSKQPPPPQLSVCEKIPRNRVDWTGAVAIKERRFRKYEIKNGFPAREGGCLFFSSSSSRNNGINNSYCWFIITYICLNSPNLSSSIALLAAAAHPKSDPVWTVLSSFGIHRFVYFLSTTTTTSLSAKHVVWT